MVGVEQPRHAGRRLHLDSGNRSPRVFKSAAVRMLLRLQARLLETRDVHRILLVEPLSCWKLPSSTWGTKRRT